MWGPYLLPTNTTGNELTDVGTIGRTSRATFGIPAKRLNITIYHIVGESLL